MTELLSPSNPLILASASPRRRELLAAASIPFVVDIPDIAEDGLELEEPCRMASILSQAKAREVVPRHPKSYILAADTVVILRGIAYGKPQDEADARRMLSELSGKLHIVVTSVTLIGPDGVMVTRQEDTEVLMRKMSAEEIARYVATGEPLDKAGAYAIQGRGSMIVEAIRGDFYNVVGLPMCLTRKLLVNAGVWI